MKVLGGGLGKHGRIVVPAFRGSNFEGVYRIGRRMTSAAGEFVTVGIDEALEQMPGSSRPGASGGLGWLAPAGVSPSEAVVLARVMVARELVEQGIGVELPGVADAFTGMRLLYVPFRKEHYFYVDTIVNAVTVEKNLVPVSGALK